MDLYCLTCGYNLHGLAGDPRRCPECGELNAIGDMRVPAEAIRAKLRQMETAPTAGVAAVLAVLFALVLLVLSSRSPADVLNPPPCFVWFIAFWVLVAVVGARRFRSSCGACEGWAGALARYLGYSLLLILGTIAGLLVIAAWIGSGRESAPMVLLVMLAVLAGVVAVGAIWVQRRVRDIIQPLQREVARRIVYDMHRWDLQSGLLERKAREDQPSE